MTRDIPCLTIWQPWASLIALGAKPFEFRGWRTPARLTNRRIGIHAGSRPVREVEVLKLLDQLSGLEEGRGTALRAELAVPLLEKVLKDPRCVPMSSIICTVIIAPSRSARALTGAEGGDSDRASEHVFAWPLRSIQPVQPMIPARGKQGFWLYPVEVAA
ncbi:ASCH domain-containing protein [Roseomonas frigidaquae]|uniref:ASCH domain-containing protein n=1 Tax=Falsiroseomonas frigidaquae TaxID=487318 RepID=A0ABX1EVZ4_9PROT|nr:ASCH domain-containing protein [Falsiroseomonas frigidaquae]NKE43550.1 ASCH domain-containing protein [Falsiroseomonas frigidaquae]